jgi:hypothetical protein
MSIFMKVGHVGTLMFYMEVCDVKIGV